MLPERSRSRHQSEDSMSRTSVAALFALAGLTAWQLATAADIDGSKSTVPKALKNRLRPPYSQPDSNTAPIVVRVVLKSNPENRVAAEVAGLPLEATPGGFDFLRGESHEESDLHTTRTPCPMLVRGETKDERLGGIVQITPDETEIVIPVGPLATVRGRLIDESTGQPIVKQRINYGVKITYPPKGFYIWGFNGSAVTDSQGEVHVPRPGPALEIRSHDLDEAGERACEIVEPGCGHSRDIPASSISATSSWVRRTNDRGGASPGRHASRFSIPAPMQAELAKAPKAAGEENKRVLVMFGGNWSEWCLKLHELLTANAEIEPLVKKGFVVVLIDANANRKLLESYAVHDACRGFPFVVMLDASGTRLRSKIPTSWRRGQSTTRKR